MQPLFSVWGLWTHHCSPIDIAAKINQIFCSIVREHTHSRGQLFIVLRTIGPCCVRTIGSAVQYNRSCCARTIGARGRKVRQNRCLPTTIVESLAGPYKVLLWKCQQLKSAGVIKDCWFFNGNINIVIKEKGERHHISHVADILEQLDMSEDQLAEIVSKKY